MPAPEPVPFSFTDALAEIESHADEITSDEFELLADFAARWFLKYLGDLNPTWGRMIQAASIETRLDSWRLLGAWTARTLEEARHINVPPHPLFVTGVPRMIETRCKLPSCGNMFLPNVPGQLYCSNKCGVDALKIACKQCQRLFVPSRPHQVMCQPCVDKLPKVSGA